MIELFLAYQSKSGIKVNDSGIGPETIIKGDEHFGYFGSIANNDFFSIAEVENAGVIPLTAGTTINRNVENIWQKYVYNGKILYIPKTTLRSGVTWNQLYNCGLVYGVEGNGTVPSNTPTSQKSLLSNKDNQGRTRYYMVRLVRGLTEDPSNSWSSINSVVTDSEYTMTVERTVPTSSNPTSWAKLGSPNGTVHLMETYKSSPTYYITANGNNNYGQRGRALKDSSTAAWLPCLELMPLDYNP